MKSSTKILALAGAVAMFAPVGLAAPALADGGKTGPQANTAAVRGELARIMSKTTMGGGAAATAALSRSSRSLSMTLSTRSARSTSPSAVACAARLPVLRAMLRLHRLPTPR